MSPFAGRCDQLNVMGFRDEVCPSSFLHVPDNTSRRGIAGMHQRPAHSGKIRFVGISNVTSSHAHSAGGPRGRPGVGG
jgi:hypothetical protein